jgi:hypothetical protein
MTFKIADYSYKLEFLRLKKLVISKIAAGKAEI